VKKNRKPFVISSHLYFDTYKLHESLQKYVGIIGHYKYEINFCHSLTIVYQYLCYKNQNVTKWLLRSRLVVTIKGPLGQSSGMQLPWSNLIMCDAALTSHMQINIT